MFCRAEIRRLKEIEKKLNDVNCELHCVLKESIEAEVMEFSRDFWKSEERLHLDETKAFFRAVSGGVLKRSSLFLTLINPVKMYKIVQNFKSIGERTPRNNLNGEGLVMGGLMVFKEGGEIVYSHREKEWGDCAPIEEVLEAAKAANKTHRELKERSV